MCGSQAIYAHDPLQKDIFCFDVFYLKQKKFFFDDERERRRRVQRLVIWWFRPLSSFFLSFRWSLAKKLLYMNIGIKLQEKEIIPRKKYTQNETSYLIEFPMLFFSFFTNLLKTLFIQEHGYKKKSILKEISLIKCPTLKSCSFLICFWIIINSFLQCWHEIIELSQSTNTPHLLFFCFCHVKSFKVGSPDRVIDVLVVDWELIMFINSKNSHNQLDPVRKSNSDLFSIAQLLVLPLFLLRFQIAEYFRKFNIALRLQSEGFFHLIDFSINNLFRLDGLF